MAYDFRTRLQLIGDEFRDHRYGRDPDVPSPAGSYPSKFVNSGTLEIDCSSLTTYEIMRLVPNPPVRAYTLADYKAFQLYNPAEKWSPIDVVQALGIGTLVSATGLIVDRTYLRQSWEHPTKLEEGGHQTLLTYLGNGDFIQVDATKTQTHDGIRTSIVTLAELSRKGGGYRLALIHE